MTEPSGFRIRVVIRSEGSGEELVGDGLALTAVHVILRLQAILECE